MSTDDDAILCVEGRRWVYEEEALEASPAACAVADAWVAVRHFGHDWTLAEALDRLEGLTRRSLRRKVQL